MTPALGLFCTSLLLQKVKTLNSQRIKTKASLARNMKPSNRPNSRQIQEGLPSPCINFVLLSSLLSAFSWVGWLAQHTKDVKTTDYSNVCLQTGIFRCSEAKNYTWSSKESEGDRDAYVCITEELNLKKLLS